MQNLFKRLMPLVSLIILLLTGCNKENKVKEKQGVISSVSGVPFDVDLVNYTLNLEDKNMKTPTGGTDLLWDNRGHTPLIAPDSHQLSFDEFNMVSGKAEVTCMNQTTTVALSLRGLIPDGVYSFWVLTFRQPGFHGNFDNLIGNGALGARDGTENVLTASPDGTAFIRANMPPGSLSVFGTIDNCLCSEYEVLLMAAYHSKNGIHAGNPGNDNSWVGQFVFPFLGHP